MSHNTIGILAVMTLAGKLRDVDNVKGCSIMEVAKLRYVGKNTIIAVFEWLNAIWKESRSGFLLAFSLDFHDHRLYRGLDIYCEGV